MIKSGHGHILSHEFKNKKSIKSSSAIVGHYLINGGNCYVRYHCSHASWERVPVFLEMLSKPAGPVWTNDPGARDQMLLHARIITAPDSASKSQKILTINSLCWILTERNNQLALKNWRGVLFSSHHDENIPLLFSHSIVSVMQATLDGARQTPKSLRTGEVAYLLLYNYLQSLDEIVWSPLSAFCAG